MTPLGFEDFWREMHPRLFHGLPRIAGDVYDSEDVIQETMRVVWQSWRRVSTCESPPTWTWRLALNILGKRSERQWRERRGLAHQVSPATTEAVDATPDDRLWAAVAALPYPSGQRWCSDTSWTSPTSRSPRSFSARRSPPASITRPARPS